MSIADRPHGGLDRSAPRAEPPPEMPRAAMDIRLPWPLGRTVLVVALLTGLAFGLATSVLGTPVYKGQLKLLVLKLNNPSPTKGVEIVDRRVTAITAIARSENFLVELQRETGVDVTIPELSKMVTATRPLLGAIAVISVTGHDEALVTTLTDHLSTALSAVVDRVRSSGGDIIASNGANVGVGDDPDYRGPLYIELFTDLSDGQATGVGFTEPRVVVNVFMGMLFAIIATAAYGAVAHERSRTSSSEDLEILLDVEQFASVPRPAWRGRGRTPRMLMGFANEVAAAATEERFAAGFAGASARAASVVGSSAAWRRRRRPSPASPSWWWISTTTAAGRGRSGDDEPACSTPHPTTTHRRGSVRWLDGGCPGGRRGWGRGVPIEQIGLGTVPDDTIDVDERLAAGIVALTADHVVLVNFPRIPGPIPIGSALGALDVGVVVLLDGWTPLVEARVVADALSSGTPGPVGSVVIEN